MKRKNVVFVYDLLLEMLDANTSTSTSASASTGSSLAEPDGLSDQPPPQVDHRGSGSSAASPGPDRSAVPRRPAQDQHPPPQDQHPPPQDRRPPPGPAETHGVPALGAEPDYSLGGTLSMETI
ncbi:hypothetical protein CRUP_035227 [Coryphaenoides rupestris]|nr:hypothetical protein CRUP_035227 [Coryphaenoides rupestris]